METPIYQIVLGTSYWQTQGIVEYAENKDKWI